MKLLSLLCCIALAAPAASVRLDALNLSLVKQGWGEARAGRSVKDLPMQIDGQIFTNGVGTHAPSTATVELDGKASRFRAAVGVNDTGRNEPGSVEFVVQGDGKTLFSSGVMRGGQPAKPVDVPLAGVRTLVLLVTDGGDNMNSDHGNWADAVIEYAGARPEIVDPNAERLSTDIYPPADKLAASPGDTTYTVDPAKGEDMGKINAIKLAPGDHVVILPGIHRESLAPAAVGTAQKPVTIEFAPGRHEFRAERAAKLCYFVSNSADAPLKPRPIGILIRECRHVTISGGKGSEIWYGDRMTEFINDRSEDIAYSGLTFDFVRPTVSEFRVLDVAPDSVTIRVAEGSTFEIRDGHFAWTGDLGPGWTMVQQAIPETGKCWRMGRWDPFGGATAQDLGGGKVKLTYKSGNMGMVAGRQFQFRNVDRDTTSAVNTRCKDIVIRNCTFHSLPGMAIVSQFTENLTYEHVDVVPRPGTIRTCPAWADCFHVSGCRGRILVESCNFSGTQDDPINVHGTHLRIVQKVAPNQILLRFMQPQTYGIPAFVPGDRVEFVNHRTLRGYATNTVAGLERKTDKDWLLTLAAPAADFGENDVVDNVTWYPDFTARNCTVTMDSCRGFLITTRGKALVENCTFIRTAMSAILVEDDAEGWFESGPIRDLTIRNNRFIECANPAVWINPHVLAPGEPVHESIRIENNYFAGSGVSAHDAKGLSVTGNRFSGGVSVSTSKCVDAKIENNTPNAKE